jgi:hypothetical protein
MAPCTIFPERLPLAAQLIHVSSKPNSVLAGNSLFLDNASVDKIGDIYRSYILDMSRGSRHRSCRRPIKTSPKHPICLVKTLSIPASSHSSDPSYMLLFQCRVGNTLSITCTQHIQNRTHKLRVQPSIHKRHSLPPSLHRMSPSIPRIIIAALRNLIPMVI